MSRTIVVVTPVAPGRGSAPARVRLESDGPRGRAHLAARLLGVRGHTVRIALAAEGALLLAGDEVDICLQVGEGCRLEVVEPAGTVAYDMRGGAASWRVAVDVETGGEVVWSGQPLVVAGSADVTRALTVTLAGTVTARLREVVVLGRAREEGGRIRQSTAVADDGHPIHREDLDLDGTHPWGGCARHLARHRHGERAWATSTRHTAAGGGPPSRPRVGGHHRQDLRRACPSRLLGRGFLLLPGEQSAWHRVRSAELWFLHRGAPRADSGR